MKKLICTAVLASSMVSSHVLAEGKKYDHTGWYVGGNLGYMGLSLDPDVDDPTSLDASSISIGPYAGYNLNEWFGIEFGTQLGVDVQVDGENVDNTTAINIFFTPKFTYQVADFVGLFFKAGVAIISLSEAESSDYDADAVTWLGVGLTAGVGAQFSLTEGLNLRVAYDYSKASLTSNDTATDGYYSYEFADYDVGISEFKLGMHYQF